MQAHAMTAPTVSKIFAKDTLVKGQPAKLECVEINGQTHLITRGLVTTVHLEDEWYEDQYNPRIIIEALKASSDVRADIFTFWQRVPDIQPKFEYYHEWESLAVLPVESYDHWLNKQVSSRLRSQIRKAMKEGVELRETTYDDAFVRGMTDIFNEAPVRQGRPFWHYGKDFETVKRQFSRFIFREEMIGAYLGDEMIGLMMLGITKNHALTGAIIGKIKHRDKMTNNLLIGRAVEVCAKKKLPYLVYLYWAEDGLAEFKRRCGFLETKVPRYFVPLTVKGKIALRLGLHRGWKKAMPPPVKSSLKKMRKLWFDFHSRQSE
jgi:hypothetical protein